METFNFIEPRKGNGTNFTKPYIPHPRMETGCQFSVQKFYKLKFYLSVSSVCVNVDPPFPICTCTCTEIILLQKKLQQIKIVN